MSRIGFARLPAVVQIMTMASIFMAWIMFEEFVIDRHHLGRFLPLYQYGNLCLYDLTAALLVVGLTMVFRAERQGRGAADAG